MSDQQPGVMERQSFGSSYNVKRPVRFDLVPESHAGHQVITFDKAGEGTVGEVLGALVLDFDSERFVENDGTGDMPSVSAPAVAGVVTLPERSAVVGPGLLPKTPAVTPALAT